MWRGVSTISEGAEYRFHVRKSGLDLPKSLDDFYCIRGCEEIELDYHNLEISAAKCLMHWLDHKTEYLAGYLNPQEGIFDALESKAVKAGLKNLPEAVRTMFIARKLQQRVSQKISDVQLGENIDGLVATFNDAMEFYRNKLLPLCRDVNRICADDYENHMDGYIKENVTILHSKTPTA
jgi:hypothetical protein